MPRIVRCALIQAKNELSTERPLAQIRKAMIDKHLKLIEQAAKKKRRFSVCRSFSTALIFAPSRMRDGMK